MRQRLIIAIVLLTAGCGRGAAVGQSGFDAVASTRDIMDGIVIPDSQAVFDAVSYVDGKLTRVPKGDDEWNRLRVRALAVAEAGNLLQMPPRVKSGDWSTIAHDMTTKAAAVAKAAEANNPDAVLLAGGELYDTCAACHGKYLPP